MSDSEFLTRKATPLEAAKSALKVVLNNRPTTQDLVLTAAYTTALYNIVEHLENQEDGKTAPVFTASGTPLKCCPVPGCGAPPEEIEGKVRCSNAKCEFSELVTKVLWQALGRVEQPEELREDVADIQHQIWAHWMKYLFSRCKLTHQSPDVDKKGTAVISAEDATRWKRQMETSYEQLSDKEKESDREQADKVLAVLRGN